MKIVLPFYPNSSFGYIDKFDKNIDAIEFRADFSADITGDLRKLRELKGDKKLIFTLRSKNQGGLFEEDPLYSEIIRTVIDEELADYVDLELDKAPHVIKDLSLLAEKKSIRLILSYHKFNDKLEMSDFRALIDKASQYAYDLLKLVDASQDIDDILEKIGLIDKNTMLYIAMGKTGSFTRIKSNFYDPLLSFAGLEDKGLGQLSTDFLIENKEREFRLAYKSYFESPVGGLALYANDRKLLALYLNANREGFEDYKNPEYFFIDLENSIIKETKAQLNQYFTGRRRVFNLPLYIGGGEFRKKIYESLLKIPLGQTVSYRELAKMAGNERASRAVGTAMAKNDIAIIIPCHRVVKSDGKIGNYGGGSSMKAYLLDMEAGFCKSSV